MGIKQPVLVKHAGSPDLSGKWGIHMMQETNMENIIGSHNILFVCIDSLRFDAAYEEEAEGGTPVLNRYGKWRKCQSPGNFTYPSHQAMFAGFLPIDTEIKEMKKREKLFFSKDIGMGRKAPDGAFLFSHPTWVEELADMGYETYCIGGLSFFDKRTGIGKVMPSYFRHSYWNPSFGCKVKNSTGNQVDFALKKISQEDASKKIMMYINISAVHYPNYFYVEGASHDSLESHKAALRYVDSQLGKLFDGFAKKGDTFVICCSDHGTCYGEDGVWNHGINHPVVNTVPYKHFIIKKQAVDTNPGLQGKIIQGTGLQETGADAGLQDANVQDADISEPYVQYMYSYPHKTAYRSLPCIDIREKMSCLKENKNSLYMHIPFCQYKCGYCNLFSVTGMENRESFMEEYVYTMERQAIQLAGALPEGVSFNDMSIGGGTPLLLPVHLIKQLFVISGKYFGIKPGKIPSSVETSPNQTDDGKLQILKENGVTRISLGVQSFSKTELKSLHRFHSPERAIQALESIKNIGFPCLNIDIIYGIPGQTEYTLLKSLDKALSFTPEELFVYPLYVKKGTYLYKRGVKRPDNTMGLYRCAREFLLSNGYLQKSMRRFIKADGSTDTDDNQLCGFGNTISIGCGGRSYIGNLHFCTPYTTGNTACMEHLSEYIRQKEFLTATNGYILSEDEIKRRYAVKHILFSDGILCEDYKKHFNNRPEEDFPVIKEWCSKGYANINDRYISLTDEGIALSDYLGPEFISGEVREKMESFVTAGGIYG